MKYAKLGKSNIDVSVLSLGCMGFSGGYYGIDRNDTESIKIINAALDLGINFFDTAQTYEKGVSERVVGEALKHIRHNVIIATKVGRREHYRSDTMVEACDSSLKNLQTDYIDLYYLHWPNMDVPFEDTMEGLEKLKKQGKIRMAGICNFGVKQMQMLEDTGKFDLLEVHQLPYSLFFRAIEYSIKQKTIEKGMSITCYSSLAQGLLSGVYKSSEDIPDYLKIARFYNNPDVNWHMEQGCEKEIFTALSKLRKLCDEAGYTLPQASLAWLLKQKGVTSPLTGPKDIDELKQNCAAADTDLSDDFLCEMTSISEEVKEKLGDNADMWYSSARKRIF